MKITLITVVGTILALSAISQNSLFAAKQRVKEAALAKSSSNCSSCCKKCTIPLTVASAHRDSDTLGPQTFISTGDPVPILFDENVIPPKGITHPVSGDSSRFRIIRSGIYQVEWHMSLDSESLSTATIALRNALTGDVFDSSELDTFSAATRSIVFCGQTLVRIPAGTIVDLAITFPAAEPGSVVNPTITFTRIAS